MSKTPRFYSPCYSPFRRFTTLEEAQAADRGYEAFPRIDGMATVPPPISPAQAAYRKGWYDAERHHMDRDTE